MAKRKELTKDRMYLDYENGVAHLDETCPDYVRADSTAIGIPEKGFQMCWKCVPEDQHYG